MNDLNVARLEGSHNITACSVDDHDTRDDRHDDFNDNDLHLCHSFHLLGSDPFDWSAITCHICHSFATSLLLDPCLSNQNHHLHNVFYHFVILCYHYCFHLNFRYYFSCFLCLSFFLIYHSHHRYFNPCGHHHFCNFCFVDNFLCVFIFRLLGNFTYFF